MCKENGVKLENEHWFDHVPKLVETNHDCKVHIWKKKVNADRTFVKLNRIS